MSSLSKGVAFSFGSIVLVPNPHRQYTTKLNLLRTNFRVFPGAVFILD
jgi:hypothetical protein